MRHFRRYLQGCHFILPTDHASLTWLLSFKQPDGQVARWLETLQSYNFDIQHRAGRHHGNADALSRRPCLTTECRYCHRQEERDSKVQTVAALTSECVSQLSPEQLRQQQEADVGLVQLRRWLEAGQRPEWSKVAVQSPELKSYYSQWINIELHNEVLYRRWQAPDRGGDILQLMVPLVTRSQVLKLVHGLTGAGHFGNAKTLRRLRGRFYWPCCRRDVELQVHCCDECTECS